MNRDNLDDSTLAFPVLSIFRGLYQRVAAKLGVDPSYVSRVARGERKSAAVLAALQEEMDVIREHLNHQSRNGKAHADAPDGELNNGLPADGQPAKGKPAKSARGTGANGRDAKAAD
jgi:transcriptional regulator with XRE-family HTH domain